MNDFQLTKTTYEVYYLHPNGYWRCQTATTDRNDAEQRILKLAKRYKARIVTCNRYIVSEAGTTKTF